MAPGNRKYFLTFKGKRYTRPLHPHEMFASEFNRSMLRVLHDTTRDQVVLFTCHEKDMHFSNHTCTGDGQYCRDRDLCIEDDVLYEKWSYTDLANTTFMLCPGGRSPASYRLIEALSVGAIPIVLERDETLLPFHSAIPWARCLFSLRETDVRNLDSMLRSLGISEVEYMHQNCTSIFTKYFSNARAIAETALQVTLQNIRAKS